MKKLFSFLIIISILGVGQADAQQFVKCDKPVEIKMTQAPDIAKNKEMSAKIKKMKEIFEADKVTPMHWDDGTDRLLLYKKKNKGEEFPAFSVRTLDGDGLMSNVTHVDRFSFEGRDYYQGRNMNTHKNCLVTADGKYIYSGGGSFAIIDFEGTKAFWTICDGANFYYLVDGSRSLYGGDSQLKYSPKVKSGLNTITVNGEVIDMLSDGTPGFFYKDVTSAGMRMNFSSCTALDGSPIGFKTACLNWFPVKESGYMISDMKFEPEIDIVARQLDGKTKTFKELRGFNDTSRNTLYTNSGDIIVDDASDITYSTPDHSIRYTIWDRDTRRKVRGAVFLRDTTLNIPPQFSEVAYAYDENAGQWKAYVRKELFSPFVPYVPGMDAAPSYVDEGERLVNQGEYWEAVSNYYNKLPDTHKWSAKDIALLNHAAMRWAKDNLLNDLWRIEMTEHGITSASENANMARTFIRHIDNETYAYAYYYADLINQKVAAHTNDAALKKFATETSKMIADDQQASKELASNVRSLYQALIDADKKPGRSAAAIEPTFREKAMAAAASATRKQQYNNDFLYTGIAMMVNNAVRRVTGAAAGRSSQTLNVTYVPGGEQGQIYTPAGDAASTDSSKPSVNTSPKCTACNGTGSCNACRGHIGKATSAKNSPDCSGCHGDGRCYVCGGSGYKSL